MLKEAIEKILELGTPHYKEHEGLTYSSQELHLVKKPEPAAVEVSTLQGLVDLYESNDDLVGEDSVIVHVFSPTVVEVRSGSTDEYGRRRTWWRAQYPKLCNPFPFGVFLAPENFIIQAHTGFQRVKIENDDGTFAKDLDYVLTIASNISAGKDRVNEDDGISQTVQTRAGVRLKAETTLRPIVHLAPYRIFSEVDQVISRFVFRARGDERGSELALFEADGGRWRLDATKAIAEWLNGKFGANSIIA